MVARKIRKEIIADIALTFVEYAKNIRNDLKLANEQSSEIPSC